MRPLRLDTERSLRLSSLSSSDQAPAKPVAGERVPADADAGNHGPTDVTSGITDGSNTSCGAGRAVVEQRAWGPKTVLVLQIT